LTDGDGDTASDTAELGALIKFEDDGPVLGEVTAVAAGALTLDESPLPGAGDGVAIQTLALAGNFAAVNYGTDGAGTTTYGFALSGSGVPVASGLYALNSVDGTFTQGTEITLSLSADGQTITGSADGEDYFTITVDDTGTVTFTQLNNIWHSDAGDADDAEALSLAAGTLVVQQTVTDQDGDSVTADLDLSDGVFVIEDDGPTNNAHTASETVHEDALDNYDPLAVLPGIRGSTGNDEGGKTTTAVFTYATIASLVSFGSDGAGAVVLNTDPSLEGTAIAGVTSQGFTLAWHVDGNVIQGVASDDRVVFTITQTAGTGTTDPTDDKFTFELLDQVDHIPLNTPSGDDDASALIDISNAFRAFDGDGDSIVLDAGLSVAVENDVPVNIDPTPMIIANSGSGAASAKLDYYLNVGADEGGTVTFTGFANGAQLTQSDGVSTVTTSGGLPVYLYGTGTGVLVASSEASFAFDPNTYDPENPPSHVVFHIVLNPDDVVEGNDTYSVEFFQELQDGSGIDFTGLGFTRAGNNTFQTTNGPDIEGVSHDLLFSAFDGSSVATVNTDSSEVSVDNNGAGINDGEGIRIDFVTNASGLGLSGNYEAYDFGTTYNGNGFSFVIAQIGNAGSTDIVLRIYDTDGDDPSNTPANTNQESATIQENHVDELANDTQDTITDIQVNGVSLNLVDDATTNVGGTNYTVIRDANNDWVVQNLQLGDQVKVFSANAYNRIELENYDDTNNGDGFSIKNFGIDVTQQGSDVSMDFDVLVTDQDGDTSTGTIGLTVTPDDGTISGTTGSDYLVGGPDDDLLIGGDGADVLIGGEGQNTYDLTDTDNAVDTVVLDPSALTGMNPDEIIGFSSEDVVDLTELVSLSTGDNIGDFVRLNPGDGKELQVDADGTAGGDDWVTVATFDVQPPASIKILYEDDNGSDTSGTV
uniref:DUF5801 repeats-in-toxin domain-containing protein n=1 Tax=uncultured Nitratireductor sp. TaxID=520953 RepID=UPI002624E048